MSRVWTLEELHLATTCRYRWFLQYELGVSAPATLPRLELMRSALQAALQSPDLGLPAQMELAEAALTSKVAEITSLGTWQPGRLWASQRLGLLRGVAGTLNNQAFYPPGWRLITVNRTRDVTIRAHGYEFLIELRLDRVDQTPQGTIFTTYLIPGAFSGLTVQLQLALLLQLGGGVAARTFDLTRQEAGGLHWHTVRPAADSPLTLARELLGRLGDALQAGDVSPRPLVDARACRSCPLKATCRPLSPEVVA